MTEVAANPFGGIGLNTKFEEPQSEPFTGIILADEITPSEYSQDGTQWHMAVRPLEYALNGDTGCYHEKANNSLSTTSKLNIYIEGLRKCLPVEFKDTAIGKGLLVGAVGRFQRQTHKFGKYEVRVTVGVARADADQVAAAKALPSLSVNPSWLTGGSTNAVSAPTAVTLSSDELSKVLSAIDGKTAIERMMVAAQLGGDLGAAVADGSAVAQLVAAGLAVLNEAGVIKSSATA